ncbi:unnamed protein product [Amoebophrya sp. A25]|nr:unnamed protein product [Amoebophrya sp. A25]|eukprot:GSA25T00005247001.1
MMKKLTCCDPFLGSRPKKHYFCRRGRQLFVFRNDLTPAERRVSGPRMVGVCCTRCQPSGTMVLRWMTLPRWRRFGLFFLYGGFAAHHVAATEQSRVDEARTGAAAGDKKTSTSKAPHQTASPRSKKVVPQHVGGDHALGENKATTTTITSRSQEGQTEMKHNETIKNVDKLTKRPSTYHGGREDSDCAAGDHLEMRPRRDFESVRVHDESATRRHRQRESDLHTLGGTKKANNSTGVLVPQQIKSQQTRVYNKAKKVPRRRDDKGIPPSRHFSPVFDSAHGPRALWIEGTIRNAPHASSGRQMNNLMTPFLEQLLAQSSPVNNSTPTRARLDQQQMSPSSRHAIDYLEFFRSFTKEDGLLLQPRLSGSAVATTTTGEHQTAEGLPSGDVGTISTSRSYWHADANPVPFPNTTSSSMSSLTSKVIRPEDEQYQDWLLLRHRAATLFEDLRESILAGEFRPGKVQFHNQTVRSVCEWRFWSFLGNEDEDGQLGGDHGYAASNSSLLRPSPDEPEDDGVDHPEEYFDEDDEDIIDTVFNFFWPSSSIKDVELDGDRIDMENVSGPFDLLQSSQQNRTVGGFAISSDLLAAAWQTVHDSSNRQDQNRIYQLLQGVLVVFFTIFLGKLSRPRCHSSLSRKKFLVDGKKLCDRETRLFYEAEAWMGQPHAYNNAVGRTLDYIAHTGIYTTSLLGPSHDGESQPLKVIGEQKASEAGDSPSATATFLTMELMDPTAASALPALLQDADMVRSLFLYQDSATSSSTTTDSDYEAPPGLFTTIFSVTTSLMPSWLESQKSEGASSAAAPEAGVFGALLSGCTSIVGQFFMFFVEQGAVGHRPRKQQEAMQYPMTRMEVPGADVLDEWFASNAHAQLEEDPDLFRYWRELVHEEERAEEERLANIQAETDSTGEQDDPDDEEATSKPSGASIAASPYPPNSVAFYLSTYVLGNSIAGILGKILDQVIAVSVYGEFNLAAAVAYLSERTMDLLAATPDEEEDHDEEPDSSATQEGDEHQRQPRAPKKARKQYFQPPSLWYSMPLVVWEDLFAVAKYPLGSSSGGQMQPQTQDISMSSSSSVARGVEEASASSAAASEPNPVATSEQTDVAQTEPRAPVGSDGRDDDDEQTLDESRSSITSDVKENDDDQPGAGSMETTEVQVQQTHAEVDQGQAGHASLNYYNAASASAPPSREGETSSSVLGDWIRGRWSLQGAICSGMWSLVEWYAQYHTWCFRGLAEFLGLDVDEFLSSLEPYFGELVVASPVSREAQVATQGADEDDTREDYGREATVHVARKGGNFSGDHAAEASSSAETSFAHKNVDDEVDDDAHWAKKSDAYDRILYYLEQNIVESPQATTTTSTETSTSSVVETKEAGQVEDDSGDEPQHIKIMRKRTTGRGRISADDVDVALERSQSNGTEDEDHDASRSTEQDQQKDEDEGRRRTEYQYHDFQDGEDHRTYSAQGIDLNDDYPPATEEPAYQRTTPGLEEESHDPSVVDEQRRLRAAEEARVFNERQVRRSGQTANKTSTDYDVVRSSSTSSGNPSSTADGAAGRSEADRKWRELMLAPLFKEEPRAIQVDVLADTPRYSSPFSLVDLQPW